MMLINPEALWELAQARQRELLAEIRLRQMWWPVEKTKHSSPKFWRQLGGQFGGSLITIGQWLQAQQQPKQSKP